MAHFYGVVNGQAKTAATRRGSKNGLSTTAASWDGAIHVYLNHNPVTGENEFTITQRPWHGRGYDEVIASGVFGKPAKRIKK